MMLKRSMTWFDAVRRSKLSSERGASLVEYALLVALIAVVCIGAVTFLGTSSNGKFDKAGKAIDGEDLGECVPYTYLGANSHNYVKDGEWGPSIDGPCP